MGRSEDNEELRKLLKKVKRLAKRYHELTGRPLGITAEVAEFEAAQLLSVQLSSPRQAGHDATCGKQRLQIKCRRILTKQKGHHAIGKIDIAGKWDAVLLVLLDEDFEITEIWKATRARIKSELGRPGPNARSRGVLSVSAFKRIGKKVWPADSSPSSAS